MTQVVRTEILMNVSQETRVAVIENGMLQEVHIERPDMRGLVGNIYRGKVARVLPGMQAAFVDIGLERAGFLHVSDVMPLAEEGQELDLSQPAADVKRWLYEGQEVLVQVIKDPLGAKGARLTMHLSVATRYLVFMPDLNHIGISLRLEDETERDRLLALMQDVLGQNPSGYIVRTAAEGIDKPTLKREVKFLEKFWKQIRQQGKKVKAPNVVHEDLPLVKRAMRDMLNPSVECVRIDCQHTFKTVRDFVKKYMPNEVDKIQEYIGKVPIFDAYAIEEELHNALERKVPLKSGGYLVIDQTEAMTTVDVNTGGFVGSLNLEETIFKTNLEAAQAIARQLRLRNLGGIIVLDFIDMQEEEHKEQVIAALEKGLAADAARTNISSLSELGLVEMTRKRTHESLAQQLCEPCPYCDGRGRVKSITTIGFEIMREVVRESRTFDATDGFMVIASEQVVTWLKEEASSGLAELEMAIGQPIKVKVEANFSQEQYEIALL